MSRMNSEHDDAAHADPDDQVPVGLPEELLQQIRARALAATEGPWQRHGSDIWSEGSDGPLFTGRDGSAELRQQADADAEFVARARDDVLALLALLEGRAS